MKLLSFLTLCGSHMGWSFTAVLSFCLFAYTQKFKKTAFWIARWFKSSKYVFDIILCNAHENLFFNMMHFIIYTHNKLISSEKTANPDTVPRGEGVQWRLISVTFTFDLVFCCWIRDNHKKIMFMISIKNTL